MRRKRVDDAFDLPVLSQQDQQIAFGRDLNRLITYYRKEYAMTGISFIGVLEYEKLNLAHEIMEFGAPEDDGEEWKGVDS